MFWICAADFNWSWPTKIERDVIERALTLDFLPEARNLILMGSNGLGKTMIAQNICHAAVQAIFVSFSAAILFQLASIYAQVAPYSVTSRTPTPRLHRHGLFPAHVAHGRCREWNSLEHRASGGYFPLSLPPVKATTGSDCAAATHYQEQMVKYRLISMPPI